MLRGSLALLGRLPPGALLTGGFRLFAQQLIGRTLAYCGATVLSFSISLAFLVRLAGGHALLYGVGYLIVIVLLLRRATPSDGVQRATDHSKPSVDGQSGE